MAGTQSAAGQLLVDPEESGAVRLVAGDRCQPLGEIDRRVSLLPARRDNFSRGSPPGGYLGDHFRRSGALSLLG